MLHNKNSIGHHDDYSKRKRPRFWGCLNLQFLTLHWSGFPPQFPQLTHTHTHWRQRLPCIMPPARRDHSPLAMSRSRLGGAIRCWVFCSRTLREEIDLISQSVNGWMLHFLRENWLAHYWFRWCKTWFLFTLCVLLNRKTQTLGR